MDIEEIGDRTFIIISYAPLLWTLDLQEPIDPNDAAKIDEVQKQMNAAVKNSAEAVAWTVNHEPVFLMDRAAEIVKHAKMWSEGRPRDWFRINWAQHDDGRYVLMIQPQYEPSKERFRARLAMYGHYADPKAKYMMLFAPVFFESQVRSATFDKIKKSEWWARVGFVQNLKDEPIWLDEFKIVGDQSILRLIK